MSMTTLYKVLSADGASCHGGDYRWSRPTRNPDGSWTPGDWTPEIAHIEPCERGYHLAAGEHQLLDWLDAAIYVAEAGGERADTGDKIVVGRARLVAGTAWDERMARLFAADCAERVLSLYERAVPGDERPRHAIETARRYATGRATADDLVAAGAAARAAAWDAAGAAARAAAWDAAEAAARAAAWNAARDAAWAAAWDAAGAAAWNAARDAARAAARDAARAAERDWQAERLRAYLAGEVGAEARS